MNSNDKSVSKYSAPTLIKYGDMAKLTASGAGSQQETNPTGQAMKFP
jgi:hypothetical protein